MAINIRIYLLFTYPPTPIIAAQYPTNTHKYPLFSIIFPKYACKYQESRLPLFVNVWPEQLSQKESLQKEFLNFSPSYIQTSRYPSKDLPLTFSFSITISKCSSKSSIRSALKQAKPFTCVYVDCSSSLTFLWTLATCMTGNMCLNVWLLQGIVQRQSSDDILRVGSWMLQDLDFYVFISLQSISMVILSFLNIFAGLQQFSLTSPEICTTSRPSYSKSNRKSSPLCVFSQSAAFQTVLGYLFSPISQSSILTSSKLMTLLRISIRLAFYQPW